MLKTLHQGIKKVHQETKIRNIPAIDAPYVDKDTILASNHTQQQQTEFFSRVQDHGLASRVGDEGKEVHENPEAARKCQCCGRYCSKEPLKLTCKTTDLDFLGSGYPLFFEFIKYSGYFLIILILSTGSYNFFSNSLKPDCKDDPSDRNHCQLTFVSRFSLADKRHNQDLNDLQMILNVFSIMALIVLLQIFRTHQREIDEQCDSGDIAPSDYALMVNYLPRGEKSMSKHQMHRYFLDKFAKHLNGTEIKISYSFNVTELMDAKEVKDQKIKEYQAALKTYYKDYPTLESRQGVAAMENEAELIKAVEDSDDKCHQIEQAFISHKDESVDDKFNGICFVSVEREQYRDAILEEFKYLEGNHEGEDFTCYLSHAPAPTDVFWENLHFTDGQKRQRKFISFIINVITLFLCFICIYYLSQEQRELYKRGTPGFRDVCTYKKELNDTQVGVARSHNFQSFNLLESTLFTTVQSTDQGNDNDKGVNIDYKKIKMLTLLISVVVIPGFNWLLLKIMTFTTFYEKNQTRTDHSISLASKLSVGMFFNTALQTFIIKIVILWSSECLESAREAIFQNGGLIYTQSSVLLMNAIQAPLLYIIDSGKITKALTRYWFMIRNKETCTLTQIQANELQENIPYIIGPRYAFIMNTMFTTAFYAPLLPIGLAYSLLALFLMYWAEKYKVLNDRVIKFNLSSKLSTAMTELLEYFLPIYCIANLVFEYLVIKTREVRPDPSENVIIDMWEKSSIYALLGIFVGFLHAFLPMKELNAYLIPTSKAIQNEYTLQEAQSHFTTTYAKQNPATREEAIERNVQQNNA